MRLRKGSVAMAGGESATRLSPLLAGEDTKPWRAAPRRSWRGGEGARNHAPSPSCASRSFDKLRIGQLRYPLLQGERRMLAS